jgi:hypothetical protein
MWIVAANTAIGSKPDDSLAIGKDCIDVIGTKTAGSSIESKPLSFFF